MVNILENIRYFCTIQGITLQDLATRCGVHYNTIHNQATANPSLRSLLRISDALGVDLSDLVSKHPGLKHDYTTTAENTLICPYCRKLVRLHPQRFDEKDKTPAKK